MFALLIRNSDYGLVVTAALVTCHISDYSYSCLGYDMKSNQIDSTFSIVGQTGPELFVLCERKW